MLFSHYKGKMLYFDVLFNKLKRIPFFFYPPITFSSLNQVNKFNQTTIKIYFYLMYIIEKRSINHAKWLQ